MNEALLLCDIEYLQNRCDSLLERGVFQKETGCLITHLSPTIQNVYVKVTLKGKTSVLLHHLILWRATQKTINYSHSNPTETVSHICGNTLCMNEKHLVIEELEYNKTRNCCKMVINNGLRETKEYKCPHDPICIWFQ